MWFDLEVPPWTGGVQNSLSILWRASSFASVESPRLGETSHSKVLLRGSRPRGKGNEENDLPNLPQGAHRIFPEKGRGWQS